MAQATLRIQGQGINLVARQLRGVEQGLHRTGTAGSRAAARLSAGFAGARRAIGGLAPILGGAGIAMGGKAILDFDDALGQLQADAGLTTKTAQKLRAELLSISKELGLNKDELVAGAQEWQDYTGVLKEFAPQMGKVAKLHKATGTPMENLARISAALMQSLGLSPEGAVTAMAKLNEQARAGAVNMRKASTVLPELLAVGKLYGFTGERGAKQMGMLLQTAGAAYGGKQEEARTGAIALMRDLLKNAKKLKKMGIRLFDPNDPKRMRDINVIMGEIGKKTGWALAGKRGMGKIFTEESIKTAGAFAKASSVQKQLEAGERGSMATVEEQLRLKLTGIAAESEKVKRALAGLDEAFQKYGKSALTWAAQNPWEAAGAAGGALALGKLGPGILRWLLGRGKGAGGAGGLAGAATGVTPVFVVNMPGAHFGQAAGFMQQGPASAAGKAGRLARGAGAAGALVGALGAGYAVGTIIDKYTGASTKLADALWEHSPVSKALRMASAARVEAHGKAVGVGTIGDQATALVRLARSGISSFESAPGKRQALTAENITAFLTASAQRQGVSQEALAPILRAMLDELKKPAVVVQGGGLDRPKVQQGRGGAA